MSDTRPGAEAPAVECRKLRRVYVGPRREHVALEGLDLTVPRGCVFGLLGPNGAGKTTTIRILSTLLLPTSGRAIVAGFDVLREAREVRRRIGVAFGGDRGFFPRLTGRENLQYYAALAGLSSRVARRRVDETLTVVQLGRDADRRLETYSRGMRQRLHVARALVADPEILFLDEPTIGLDPEMAQEFRALVPSFARSGKAVLLTTHYMREAELLCDRLSIIDQGRLIATGTPHEIRRRFGRSLVCTAILRHADRRILERLRAIPGVVNIELDRDDSFYRLKVFVAPGTRVQDDIIGKTGVDNVDEVIVRDLTLEEAYLAIVAEHRKTKHLVSA